MSTRPLALATVELVLYVAMDNAYEIVVEVASGWTCEGVYVSKSVWCYEAGRFLRVTGANGT
jgi:hypothetical protein